MNDCISRLEVLEEINRIGVKAFTDYASYSNFFDFVSNLPTVERPRCEWISVSERLPNMCGVYNVTKRVIEGGRCYYIADSCYFDGTETWHDDNRINFGRERVNCIIAWQPLPEPYKEAHNDE